jgi:hypothetical protein
MPKGGPAPRRPDAVTRREDLRKPSARGDSQDATLWHRAAIPSGAGLRPITLPSGRSVSVIETVDDPSRPWQANSVGRHYIVQRERHGNVAAREAATGIPTLAVVLDKPDAEALAAVLNAPGRRR